MRENPDDETSEEASFARQKGWRVEWDENAWVIRDPKLPKTGKLDPARDRFKTIPGAWLGAAIRAGWRPAAISPTSNASTRSPSLDPVGPNTIFRRVRHARRPV